VSAIDQTNSNTFQASHCSSTSDLSAQERRSSDRRSIWCLDRAGQVVLRIDVHDVSRRQLAAPSVRRGPDLCHVTDAAPARPAAQPTGLNSHTALGDEGWPAAGVKSGASDLKRNWPHVERSAAMVRVSRTVKSIRCLADTPSAAADVLQVPRRPWLRDALLCKAGGFCRALRWDTVGFGPAMIPNKAGRRLIVAVTPMPQNRQLICSNAVMEAG
jgi:hypothetical protein